MPIEQEPIKIEIPVEEDEVVLVPERRGTDVAQRLEAGARRSAAGARQGAERAREVWQSERREQVQAGIVGGLRRGARVSRLGLVHGLKWLSARLAGAAERFTPVE